MDDEDSTGDNSDQLAQAPPQPSLGPGRQFRDEIAKRESQGQPDNGYGTTSPQLGRYQMTKDALIDAGLKDKQGNWTGKYNINNDADFLGNHNAQDLALADYMRKMESYLKGNKSMDKIGQNVDGVLAKFSITESGLMAAGHREGHKPVRRYLEWQNANNWTSKFSSLPPDDQKMFEKVEKRLREFERIAYR